MLTVRSSSFLLCLRNNQTLKIATPSVMKIINMTPDSFYDVGKNIDNLNTLKKKLIRVLNAGVCFIDIGGESSRPGANHVSADEEWMRIKDALIMLNALKKQFPQMLISLDTTKVKIAKQALKIGIDLINDISAGDSSHNAMLKWIITEKLPIVLMHKQGNSATMQNNPTYGNVVKEVFNYLKKKIQVLKKMGIAKNKIIIDVGIGFGKTQKHNTILLQNLAMFKKLHHPILIGASMKRIVGDLTGTNPKDRLAGSIGLQLGSIKNGADIVRVHHSREMLDAIKTFCAIIKK